MTAVDDSDGSLAARALAGEDTAFARLVTRHKGWAFRFIRRYVGNADDAYDILQDTFFSAWTALARYQRDRPFDIWLRRIALNKCRDRARRERLRRLLFTFGGDEDEPAEAPNLASPELLVESEQQVRRMEAALGTLPRQLKEALLLTALEGLSHQQAGELLGISSKAVEMRVYRARHRLQQLFDPQRQTS